MIHLSKQYELLHALPVGGSYDVICDSQIGLILSLLMFGKLEFCIHTNTNLNTCQAKHPYYVHVLDLDVSAKWCDV